MRWIVPLLQSSLVCLGSGVSVQGVLVLEVEVALLTHELAGSWHLLDIVYFKASGDGLFDHVEWPMSFVKQSILLLASYAVILLGLLGCLFSHGEKLSAKFYHDFGRMKWR